MGLFNFFNRAPKEEAAPRQPEELAPSKDLLSAMSSESLAEAQKKRAERERQSDSKIIDARAALGIKAQKEDGKFEHNGPIV